MRKAVLMAAALGLLAVPLFAQMPAQTAEEIVGRLDDCSAAELAGAELYEAANKQRSTVLAAVERQLKARASRAGS